jgi:hypothetical protein
MDRIAGFRCDKSPVAEHRLFLQNEKFTLMSRVFFNPETNKPFLSRVRLYIVWVAFFVCKLLKNGGQACKPDSVRRMGPEVHVP